MARIQNGKATLVTRGGHDWSAKMPRLVKELGQLSLKSAWLDGEIVVLDDSGLPNFNTLQKAFDRGTGSEAIVLFLFDVPYFEGYDLRDVALSGRRQLLKALLDERASEHVRYSADFESDPTSIISSACKMNLEGVIAKRLDAPYTSRRTETWLKLKCKQRQEFVVCGYTDRSDGSPQIGSLLLGVHAPNGDLVSVGSVGTGWNSEEARVLKHKLETPKPPFKAGAAKPGRWSKRVAGSERWVEPRAVAEVAFAEWTPDGQIRHASYLRNGQGATTAAAFSARARPGLGVSMPVAWDALPTLKSGAQWAVATAREYLSFQTVDPWADYWSARQSLAGAMKTLGFVAPRRKVKA